MKTKTLMTGALLAFVAASVAALIFKETRAKPVIVSTPATAVMEQPANKAIVAYYFHGNVRCATCRKIEALSREAIETGFTTALHDGRLQWRVVNVEEPVNEHFVKDYELSTRSLVLVEAGGHWKNLTDVWKLVGDRDAFVKYVQEEVRQRVGTP